MKLRIGFIINEISPVPPELSEDENTFRYSTGIDSNRTTVGEANDGYNTGVRCYVVANVEVRVIAERVQYYDSSGKLIVESLKDYFTKYGELARRVLEALLDKYADAGVGQIEEAQVLTVAPFTQFGTPLEIVRIFGGTAQYQEAIRDLKRSLYSA